jgi:hypothetical protein
VEACRKVVYKMLVSLREQEEEGKKTGTPVSHEWFIGQVHQQGS